MEVNCIYNESCLETMGRMSNNFVTLTVTDPPFGIDLEYDNYVDSEENWFTLMDQALPEIKRVSKMSIIHACRIDRLEWIYTHHPPDWLIICYKGSTGHRSFVGFNDWEPLLVYGKSRPTLTMHDYYKVNKLGLKGNYGHPCPKSEDWAKWIIERASNFGDLVYDPFAGSGTISVVAKSLQRLHIASEISPKYVEIARKRLNYSQPYQSSILDAIAPTSI